VAQALEVRAVIHEGVLHVVLKAVVAWRLRNIYRADDVGTECQIDEFRDELWGGGSVPIADVCGRIGNTRIYAEVVVNYLERAVSKAERILEKLRDARVILVVPYEKLWDLSVALMKSRIKTLSSQVEVWVADLLIIEVLRKLKESTPFSQYMF